MQKQKAKEEAECTFTPRINNLFSNTTTNECDIISRLYYDNIDIKENKYQKLRELKENKLLEECTFQPNKNKDKNIIKK